MDAISIVIYVCAALGGVLTLLCIVLITFLICVSCKKHCHPSRDAEVALPPQEASGDVVLHKCLLTPGKSPKELQVSAVHAARRQHSDAAAAPVRKKLFWKKMRKGSKREPEPAHLLVAELPKSDVAKKKRAVTFSNKRRSKSDWYIYSRCQSEDDLAEDTTLLYPHQVISLIGKPQLHLDDDLKQSQYFDALDTIVEEAENNVAVCVNDDLVGDQAEAEDHEWMELDDQEEDAPAPSHSGARPGSKCRRGRIIVPSDPAVKRRLKALKRLQYMTEMMEAKFYRELYDLEARFNAGQRESLYQHRRAIILELESCEESPGQFWLKGMQNSRTLSVIIQPHDVPVLKSLKDIRIVAPPAAEEAQLQFSIDFYFQENPYFTNRILSKEYFLRCEPNPSMPFIFDGPEVVHCRGCKINWLKGKNVTLRPVKKLNSDTGEFKTKFAKRNSFFNFFTPPGSMQEWLADPKKSSLMEAHFEIGLFFKEHFVPKAILYFLNHSSGLDNCSKTSNNRRRKPGTHKALLSSSNSISPESHGTSFTTSQADEEASQHGAEVKRNGAVESASAEPEPPAVDPLIGRYRLVSSDGFDHFMKALGVGLVRQKLASSVWPVTVIDIDREGMYTIRTETSVRTTEIKFRLNEPFMETTLDGRTTQTTPSRTGNVLILDQKGDAKKGDKSSRMVRDVQGDRMVLTMTVDRVVCTRIYQRIAPP